LSAEAKDELLELTEQLIFKIKDIIDNKLTKRQSEVVKLIFFEQKTQMEVAYLLGLCQTTIHKLIHGNLDYSNGGKRYGGAVKKIRKLCQKDPEIQQIMARIDCLRRDL
jgi:predicted transcriptional regulator